jgi:hypothetical protein
MWGRRNRVRSAGYTVYRPFGAPAKLPGVVRHPQAIGALVRRLLFALALVLPAADAGAQIIRQPRMRTLEPTAWFSIGAGLQNTFGARDGTTGSTWEFGDATQYVASIERVLSGGASVGVRGTHARVPLRYTGTTTGDADANVSQVLGVLHVASGREFHSVLELSLGATIFSNFRSRTADERLEPTSDTDFTFAFGYGFGYNFSPRFAVDLVQDMSTAMHQKTNLGAGEGSSIRINSTRLIARVALGGR